MVQSYLKRDTMLLVGFFIVTLLMVSCAVLLSMGSRSESPLICGAAVLCIGGLLFSFLTIAGHLNTNAEELYGEEIRKVSQE